MTNQDMNVQEVFAKYEDTALLWLHRNVANTLEQYAQLAGSERDSALLHGVPLWKIIGPAIECELSTRCLPFSQIKFPDAAQTSAFGTAK